MILREVIGEHELLKALKDNCDEIRIVGSFAKKAHDRYSLALSFPPLILSKYDLIFSLFPDTRFLIRFYRIKLFRDSELIIEKEPQTLLCTLMA